MTIEEKTILWKPVSEYTGGRVLATNGLDILVGELNPEGDCVSEDCSGTHLCGITHFAKIDGFFPTLRESEDEKIRRALIDYFDDADNADENPLQCYGIHTDKAIAWLEKQGEHTKFINGIQVGDKVTRNKDGVLVNLSQLNRVAKPSEKQGEQKPADKYNIRGIKSKHAEGKLGEMIKEIKSANKIEPKFKVGDIIKPKDGGHEPWQIMQVDVFDKKYRFKDGYVVHFSQEEDYELIDQKFKVGDWVVKGDTIAQILDIQEQYYVGLDINGKDFTSSRFLNDDKIHLWTIQDAKDGDVLSFNDDTIVMFKDLYSSTTFHSYCHIEDGVFDISKDEMPDWWEGKGFYPATKKQCDLLFAKMKEAGYEWDAEKKELKKINTYCQENCKGFQETGRCFADGECKAKKEYIEQKHNEWGEEDERERKRVVGLLEGWLSTFKETNYAEDCKRGIEWLKSLNGKIQPKQEWSEEDNLQLQAAVDICKSSGHTITSDWLKSLNGKIQPKQEWSEEDKDYYDAIITKLEVTKDDALLTDNQMEFLKSLKDKIQVKQEWSEEDETTKIHTLQIIKKYWNSLPDTDYSENEIAESCCNWLKSLNGKIQPKQEWSKDDITRINEIIETLNIVQANRVRTQRMHYSKATIDKNIDWLKSLKDIVQPKQEWSEEDDSIVESILFWLKSVLNKSSYPRYEHWLNSLKPQNHWKPTEEQLTSLTIACDRNDKIGFDLTELLEKLKKL